MERGRHIPRIDWRPAILRTTDRWPVTILRLSILPTLLLLTVTLVAQPVRSATTRISQVQGDDTLLPAGEPEQAPADSSVVAGADAALLAPADAPEALAQPSASDSLGSVDTTASAALGDSLAIPNIAALEPPDIWDTGISSTAAVLMTPVFPGWGQLYVESSWRGMLAFGVEWFYWSNMISRDRQARRARDFGETVGPGQLQDYYNALADEYWEQMRDFAWWSAGVLLIIALDAYVGAKLFHFDEEPLPVPNDWSEHFGANAPLPPGGRDPLNLVVFRWRKTF